MSPVESDVTQAYEDFLPTGIPSFDSLIMEGGFERGSIVLLNGSAGTGKTIFAIQSIYQAALNGEKSVYLAFEENPRKMKKHFSRSFGWDLAGMEDKGLISFQRIDPFDLATDVELTLKDFDERRKLTELLSLDELENPDRSLSLIDHKGLKMPYKPDRIVLDSLSALASAFVDREYYRLSLELLFLSLNRHNSVNIAISEQGQDPHGYSKGDVEEFLSDGVISMYNIRKGGLRRRAIEVIKLRFSDHVKEMIPYVIDNNGIRVLRDEKI